MKKGDKVKIALIILTCVAFDMVLHVVTSSYSTMPENPELSILADFLGMELTAFLWALFAFSGVAFVFWICKDKIPGKGVRKGLHYGTAIALLWLFAMLEGVPLFGNSINHEFVIGLSDAVPVFVLSILLSKLLTKKEKDSLCAAFFARQKIL
jgi:hypothetical protein